MQLSLYSTCSYCILRGYLCTHGLWHVWQLQNEAVTLIESYDLKAEASRDFPLGQVFIYILTLDHCLTHQAAFAQYYMRWPSDLWASQYSTAWCLRNRNMNTRKLMIYA